MSKYVVDTALVCSGYTSDEQLERLLDCILDFLYEDDRAVDPDYTATLSAGRVEYHLSVEADNEPRALDSALSILRAAVHAADGCTPGWEATFKQIHAMIREAEGQLLEV
jgi:hypothetical protein